MIHRPLATLVMVAAVASPLAASTDVISCLESEGRFTRFLELIETAGMTGRLRAAGALTVLAPADAAFADVPAEISDAFLEAGNRDALRRMLEHHLVEGRRTLADLGSRARFPSVMGDELALRQIGDDAYAIDAAAVLEVDLDCGDAIVHVLAEPLLPLAIAQEVERRLFGVGRHAYEVDLDHSTILFRTVHVGVGAQWGWFRAFKGEITVDHDDLAGSSVVLAVDVSSIDTNNTARDRYLQTEDFFDAANHPGMTFRSTKVTPVDGGDDLQIDGELTLRGVTKPLGFVARKVGEGRFGPRHYKVGYEGRFTIRRSDHGMTFGIPGVAADEVELVVALEATRPLDG